MYYNINQMAEDAVLWENLRIYFNEKHIKSLCNIQTKSNTKGDIMFVTIMGKHMSKRILYRILSFSNFYFDLKKHKFIFPDVPDDSIVKRFLLKMLKVKYMIKTEDDISLLKEFW